MNVNELRAEMFRRGVKASDAAGRLGISPSTLYRKMRGKSEFFQSEIIGLSEMLELDNDRIMAVFFNR